ncbi:MAG TPA: DUF397 domain-containing protein [Pseudonocardiaceae bacterium]|jgi:hypothetical protein|nr:DUF397 domain-containing protein [Pseudonocardiaceae bacterium]
MMARHGSSWTSWRKSSYSSGTSVNTNCVEVAAGPDRIGVRDSKTPAATPLAFGTNTWRAFLAATAG